jgi:penicillin-insensitive murein DD-endopeptidase
VAKQSPGSVLNVGHLSKRGGGEVDRHASHESGRDADIGFYLKKGNAFFLADHFLIMDEHGKGDGGVTFDTARNWQLVVNLLTDAHARVTHIFVVSHLRDRLLAYGKQIGTHADIRERAAMVLAQPHGALPHDDHFHVRIACPNRMEGCIELPERPHHREHPVARSRGGKGANHTHDKAGAKAHEQAHAKSEHTGKSSEHPNKGKKPSEAPITKPSKPEDPLDRLIGPRVEGLDAVLIPARVKKVEAEPTAPESDQSSAPAKDEAETPAERFDDVDGPGHP